MRCGFSEHSTGAERGAIEVAQDLRGGRVAQVDTGIRAYRRLMSTGYDRVSQTR